MDHAFIPSSLDSGKCGNIIPPGRLCQHPSIAHTDKAECDYCDYVGVVKNDANNGLACPNCLNLVVKIEPVNTSQGPISINEVIRTSRDINYSLGIKTDIFNANTTAIQSLRESIYSDDTIPVKDKPNRLAAELFENVKKYQKLIFDKSDELKDLNSTQRQYQVELNKVANELRAEEREKYRLIDINYKPKEVKTETKVKKISVRKSVDKAEVRAAAARLGIAEFTLQAVIVSKNMTVMEAEFFMKKNIEDAKRKMEEQTTGT